MEYGCFHNGHIGEKNCKKVLSGGNRRVQYGRIGCFVSSAVAIAMARQDAENIRLRVKLRRDKEGDKEIRIATHSYSAPGTYFAV